MPKSSTDNASTGVFARLIENWLTSTPERGFEVPFCQLLLGEGHQIIHIDSHSPQEDGKDVISVDASGKLCGFQLKSGNISVSRWRDEIQGELRELVEMPCHHPNVKDRFCERAFLVTTGSLSEPALHKLERFNTALPDRFTKVLLCDKNDLLSRFLTCNDAVLPSAPSDFKAFLELMLADGQEPLDKAAMASFLESLSDTGSTGEMRRQLAASAIMTSYAASSHVASDNHLAEAEAWSLCAVHVVRISLTRKLNQDRWLDTAHIACDAAVDALNRLAAEALENTQLMPPNPMGDGGIIWRSRLTLVCGAMAAARIARRQMHRPPEDETPYLDFIRKNIRHMFIWGESAAANVLLIYWYLASSARHQIDAENFLAFGYLRSVATANGRKTGTGLPGPHFSPEECLKWGLGLEPELFESQTFRSLSYTMLPSVFLLVRALRRQALGVMWYNVSNVGHCQVNIAQLEDFLLYKSPRGTFVSEHLPRPCSWKWLSGELHRRSRDDNAFRAPEFTACEALPVLFTLTHPHRLTVEFTLWLDNWITSRA